MNSTIEIANRIIGAGQPPYLIAEMSANHNGEIENAFRIIDEAKNCGADAVKIQTYRPDTLTLNCDSDDFKIKGGLWNGRTLYDLYQEAHMPWDWHEPLFEYARRCGITLFSSPFDSTAIDLLENLNAPAYKIASFEAIDLPLIKYAAKTGKPLIISTGIADAEEIQEAVDAARSVGCQQLALLHCVSAYPAPSDDYNLLTMADMANRFGVVVGLSDHTIGNVTSFASVALGASIIEKHFTLDRCGGGPDDSFSLEPAEFNELCQGANVAWRAVGKVNYGIKSSERGSEIFRRSLYFVKDLKAGDVITPECVKSVRPGYGLAPKNLDLIMGKSVRIAVKANTRVSRDLVNSVDWTKL